MFHFAFAQVVQVLAPLAILLQIVSNTFREQNVPGIAAVHHPLRNVDSRACDVRSLAYVHKAAYGSAVDSHAHLQIRMTLEGLGDLQRTDHRRIRRCRKTSAMPSPVGSVVSLPAASAVRNESVARTRLLSVCK